MNKITFVGIILIIGLFSLQYSLVGLRGTNMITQEERTPPFETLPPLESQIREVQVIYICPDDSVKLKKIRRSADMLL